jgi:hypothetical protein
MTAPVLHLSQRPQWYQDAEQAPPTRAPRHPGQHRTALAAWNSVTTERVRDRRHLLLPDPIGDGELVTFALVEHSPYWTGWERTAGVWPIWTGPVVYAPSPYAAYGGAGLTGPRTAGLTIRYGLDQARAWGAQALILPHLTRDLAATAATAVEPDVDLFANFAYTAPVHPGGAAGHLADNPDRRTARNHARELRRATDAGLDLRVLQGPDLERELPAFVDLARQVDTKHGTTKFGPDVVTALAAVPGAVLLAAQHQGRMVGGFLCFAADGVLYLSTSGIDYSRLRQLHTYTWLMGASLDYAARIGAHTIDAGRSNHQVKRRWNLRPTELRTLVYLTDPTDTATFAALTDMSRLLAKAAGSDPDSGVHT